jgi:hypothetical protein
MTPANDFKWDDLSDDSIVTRGVRATAVYTNPAGEIVIRQEAFIDGEEDPFVVLPVRYAEELLKRLAAVIAEAKS